MDKKTHHNDTFGSPDELIIFTSLLSKSSELSSELTDLGWLLVPFFTYGIGQAMGQVYDILKCLAHFDRYLIVLVDLIPSERFPCPVPVLRAWSDICGHRVDPKTGCYCLSLIKHHILFFSCKALALLMVERLWGGGSIVRRCKTAHTGESR